MKKRLLVLSVISCVIGGNAFAQQDKLLTHFMYDKMSINPGATGLKANTICGTSIYRNQWDKVNGAPNSIVFNVDADLSQYNIPVRPGIAFYHDEIGFTRQNTAVLNVAYPLNLGSAELSIGVGLGIMNLGMDPLWVPPTSTPDPTLPAAFGSTQFDANFGVYLSGDANGNPYYAGLSSTHLPAPQFDGDSQLQPGTPIGYNSARHYYVTGGYTLKNIVQGDDIETNFLLRSDLIKTSFDLNARYMWQGKAYGGLTYRMSDAIGIMLGAKPFDFIGSGGGGPDFIVGYSYDITINKLSSISWGSHEILLKYCYPLPPIPITKSKHPRWL